MFFHDDKIQNFNTNFKVSPPLRTADDTKALIAGLKDGTIDMITSDHNPLNIELKNIEFDNASFGTIGLESAFGALNMLFPIKTTINLLTRGKNLFGIDDDSIKIGNTADLTLFNPLSEYLFDEENILSKSKNSMFIGSKLKGKVYGVINKGQVELN